MGEIAANRVFRIENAACPNEFHESWRISRIRADSTNPARIPRIHGESHESTADSTNPRRIPRVRDGFRESATDSANRGESRESTADFRNRRRFSYDCGNPAAVGKMTVSLQGLSLPRIPISTGQSGAGSMDGID